VRVCDVQGITEACVNTCNSAIPFTKLRQQSGRIAGWSEYVQPLRQKSFFGIICGSKIVDHVRGQWLIACDAHALRIIMQFVLLRRTNITFGVNVL